MAQDAQDWTKGLYTIPFTPPFMPGVDFPDWVDGVLSVAGLITPGEDFPDWTKATGQVGNVFPNPPPITGMFAWYDATRIGGLADADTLPLWSDASGNGYSAVAGADPPIYRSTGPTIINGLPVVQFDGVSSILTATTMPALPQPFTVYSVFQCASVPSNVDPNQIIFASDAAVVFFGIFVTPPAQWGFGAGSVDPRPVSADTAVHQMCCVFNSPNSIITLDASTLGSGRNIGTGGLTAGGTVLGGVAPPASVTWDGTIGEVIIYAAAHNNTQQTTIRNYLKAKWNTP